MNFERMGYRNLERSQSRIETNEYSDTFKDFLLPGEKWEYLTLEEQSERIDAYRDGTLKELLEKKLEEREKDTSVEDALKQLNELLKQMKRESKEKEKIINSKKETELFQ